jgi:hypothetical protein
MGTSLIAFLLGACCHRHQSRPFTLDNQTYTVCLNCGEKIGYSLENMAPLSLRERRQLKMQKANGPSKDKTKHERQEKRNRMDPIWPPQ